MIGGEKMSYKTPRVVSVLAINNNNVLTMEAHTT
jgi:hypothetical protein